MTYRNKMVVASVTLLTMSLILWQTKGFKEIKIKNKSLPVCGSGISVQIQPLAALSATIF